VLDNGKGPSGLISLGLSRNRCSQLALRFARAGAGAEWRRVLSTASTSLSTERWSAGGSILDAAEALMKEVRFCLDT
jgi:hypothetical protein